MYRMGLVEGLVIPSSAKESIFFKLSQALQSALGH